MIKLLIKNSTSFTGNRRSLLLPQGLQPGLSPRSRDLLDKEQFYLHLTHQKLMINYISDSVSRGICTVKITNSEILESPDLLDYVIAWLFLYVAGICV